MNSADCFKCTFCDYESRHFNRLALHYKYVHALDPGFRLPERAKLQATAVITMPNDVIMDNTASLSR